MLTKKEIQTQDLLTTGCLVYYFSFIQVSDETVSRPADKGQFV